MRRLYDHNEQARHPHLLEENYFTRLHPCLVYAGAQSNLPGAQNVVHTHPFLEMEFVKRGHGHVLLDGVEYPVTAGDLVVYNAGVPHCEFSDEDDPLDFYFTAYDKVNMPNLPPNCILDAQTVAVLHTGGMADDFHQLFHRVLKELERDQAFGYEIALAMARIVLMLLFRLLNQSCNARDLLQNNRALQDAVRYIDRHFTGEITLEQLASACMVSKYYLSHLFTRGMGQSVGRYILEKRLYMARHLLASTDLSVEQVSLQSGFSDSAYFCRLFKKEQGCTPTQFRRENLATANLATAKLAPAKKEETAAADGKPAGEDGSPAADSKNIGEDGSPAADNKNAGEDGSPAADGKNAGEGGSPAAAG